MKLFQTLVLALGLTSLGTFAQDVAIEELPVATIDENFYVTLPEIPLEENYFIDLSHIDFEDALDAETQIRAYLTANLISPELNYEENYVILHVHTEYMGGDLDLTAFQTYLGRLSKPY